MGRASSSKKVARASRAGGGSRAARSIGWPVLIGAVVVIGAVLIVVSRGSNEDVQPPLLGDHWHAAYAIYDCGEFLPALDDVVPDETGLHTHGDGLMHIHPFSTRYTGEGANIENFGMTVGLEVTDTSFSVDGVERENGESCGDLGDGVVQLKVWDSPEDPEGRLIEGDIGEYAPPEFSLWTLAFVPEGAEIPKPPPERIEALRAPVDVVGPTPSLPPVSVDPATDPTAPATDPTAPATEPTDTTEPGDTTATSEPAPTDTSAP